jgi:hypothetical protein
MSKQTLEDVFAKRKAKEVEKEKKAPKNELKDKAPFIARFGEVTLDGWKKENGNRDLIYLKVDDFLAVLRPPLAEDLGDYLTAIGTNGMSKAVAMIVEQLWLDGDFELIEDEDLFIAVFLQINQILEGKKGEFFRA